MKTTLSIPSAVSVTKLAQISGLLSWLMLTASEPPHRALEGMRDLRLPGGRDLSHRSIAYIPVTIKAV